MGVFGDAHAFSDLPAQQISSQSYERMMGAHGSGDYERGNVVSGMSKPPPVAMRSSLTIGLPSPRSRFGGSFEDIGKKV